MASKLHQRRKACEGKVRYSSQEEAGRHAGAATHIYHAYFTAYRCSFCGGFHIGKPPKEVRRALKMRRGITTA